MFTPTRGSKIAKARAAGRLLPNSWVDPKDISRIVKRRFAAVGIVHDGMAAHSLRATAAVLAYQAGADLLEIQQLLRHKSLDTTRIYLSWILPQASDAAIDSIKLNLR